MEIIIFYLQQLAVVASVFHQATTVLINVQQVRWDRRVRLVEPESLAHLDHQVKMESLAAKGAKAKVLKDHVANEVKGVQ